MKTSNIKILLAAAVIGGTAALFSDVALAQVECLNCGGPGGGGVGFEKDTGVPEQVIKNIADHAPREALINIMDSGKPEVGGLGASSSLQAEESLGEAGFGIELRRPPGREGPVYMTPAIICPDHPSCPDHTK